MNSEKKLGATTKVRGEAEKLAGYAWGFQFKFFLSALVDLAVTLTLLIGCGALFYSFDTLCTFCQPKTGCLPCSYSNWVLQIFTYAFVIVLGNFISTKRARAEKFLLSAILSAGIVIFLAIFLLVFGAGLLKTISLCITAFLLSFLGYKLAL